MMEKPLVSVVVPLYNYSRYVRWCLLSIINQDYDNYEVIVVDDHSTDNSYEAAKEYENDKIQVIRLGRNRGYSRAKNEAISMSKGEYITALDADDMLTKNSLSVRVKHILETGCDFIHAQAINVKGKMSLQDCYNMTGKKRRVKAVIHAQTVMVHRSVYERFGLYDETLRSRSDKEMWIRLFGKNKDNVLIRDIVPGRGTVNKVKIDDDVAYYRVHKKSMMRMRKKNHKYNKKVTNLLMAAIEKRGREGITKDNTRFLSPLSK